MYNITVGTIKMAVHIRAEQELGTKSTYRAALAARMINARKGILSATSQIHSISLRMSWRMQQQQSVPKSHNFGTVEIHDV